MEKNLYMVLKNAVRHLVLDKAWKIQYQDTPNWPAYEIAKIDKISESGKYED